MSIHFIPNDPRAGAGAPTLRSKRPARNRSSARAGLNFHDREPEKRYSRGTPGFVYWQCREAALTAIATWEHHAGKLNRWALNRKRMDLFQNAVRQLGEGMDLNAYYDRSSFAFFEYDDGGRTTFSGESTDVVAHEIGHGLLDSIRPELWDTPYLEVNAFHEAFGDSMALLTALGDPKIRRAVLERGLGKRNFVETVQEDLAYGVRRVAPTDNSAAPRRAFNKLRWQLPSSLPTDGGPGELINESHSFAQVFTGCFWDLIRNLLGSGTTTKALDNAVEIAAKLLLAGAQGAPESPRFFQAIGRAMVLADGELQDGSHHLQISDAFRAHGIALGSNAMLSPVAGLAGSSPGLGKGAAALSETTRRDLKDRLGAAGRVVVKERSIAGARVVQAVHQREVPLGTLGSALKGVVAIAPESVLVGGSGGRAAVLGGLPQPSITEEEVMTYVDSLVKHQRIEYSKKRKPAEPRHPCAVWHSHTVRKVDGKRVLTRVRFACGAFPLRPRSGNG